MLTIPLSELPPILVSLYLCAIGLDHFTKPIAGIIRRAKFDFEDAIIETLVGIFFILLGFILLVIFVKGT